MTDDAPDVDLQTHSLIILFLCQEKEEDKRMAEKRKKKGLAGRPVSKSRKTRICLLYETSR